MAKYGTCTQERLSLEKDMVQGAAFAVAIGCIVVYMPVFLKNLSFALVILCDVGNLVGMSVVYRDASPCESLEF